VVLSTERPIDLDAVKEICCLPDDLYRLRWVSYAYYDIHKRLARNFGKNASWPAFARWSAYTISEALRLDRPNKRLAEVLRENALPDKVSGPLVAIQRRLRSLDDGAMPVVLALGNRLVFHEVGWTMVEFLDWIKANPEPNEADFARYKVSIQPTEETDFFRACYVDWLRDGVEAYYRAWHDPDEKRKAQHILRGNILIGAYEQWRVDSFFEVALDFNPGALIKDIRIDHHNAVPQQTVNIRHAGTRKALRHQWAMIDWMSDAYAAFLTRFILTWDAPLFGAKPTALRLGADIPRGRRKALYEYDLASLGPEVKSLFATFDRSNGKLQGSGARNWRRFGDRMSFIVNLFRTQQQNPNLTVDPSYLERRLLELQLTDAHLDTLRGIGDSLDQKLIAGLKLGRRSLKQFTHGVALRHEDFATLQRNQQRVGWPEWADKDKVAEGQTFFKDHAMEIASALFCASLPTAYTAARGSRVLLETAELVSDVTRRIAETGQMLFDVMLPDPHRQSLQYGSVGYKTALTVRGYHAAIRKLLQDREPWKTQWLVPMSPDPETGESLIDLTKPLQPEVPINQEDLLGTLTTFTVVVIESLERMGIKVEDAQRDAYLHTWLLVGHLLGIDYDRLRAKKFNKKLEPLTYFEMQLIRDSVFRRHAAPSPSGQILTRALLGLQESALPWALKPLPPAAIRRFIGDDAADMLEVPPAGPIRVALDALGPVGSAADWFAQGKVLRPQLAAMSANMFQHWMAEKLETQQGWIDKLPPRTLLEPDLPLKQDAENRKHKDPKSLWEPTVRARKQLAAGTPNGKSSRPRAKIRRAQPAGRGRARK
jgi:hypothetical protein